MTAVATDPREDFSAWWQEHYDTITVPGRVSLRCKRCSVPVFHVTRHAAEVHGDPIEVMPVKVSEASRKRWTDVYGPDVIRGVEPKD